MDDFLLEHLRKYIPFLDSIPIWLWFIIFYLLLNLLIKPYIKAVVKLYEPNFDIAAQKTRSLIKRFLIEFLRLILISGQIPHSLFFVMTPPRKRLRIWRKNYVVFFIWIYSKNFPSMKHYSDIRKWFEKNVYYNEKTSHILPEPLKEDGIYIEEMLLKDKFIDHKEYILRIESKFKPIVRVGAGITTLNPKVWMGNKFFIRWIIYSWIYTLFFIISIYFIISSNLLLALTFVTIGIISFKIDRYILTKKIINYAKENEDFYYNAVESRVIQLNW